MGKPDKPYYVAPFLLCGVALILISWLAAWRVKSAPRLNGLPAIEKLTSTVQRSIRSRVTGAPAASSPASRRR